MAAQFIRVSEGALGEISQTITAALIAGQDEQGRQVVIETIDPAVLRAISLAALTSAAGKPVLPSSTVIEVEAERHYPWLKRTYPR